MLLDSRRTSRGGRVNHCLDTNHGQVMHTIIKLEWLKPYLGHIEKGQLIWRRKQNQCTFKYSGKSNNITQIGMKYRVAKMSILVPTYVVTNYYFRWYINSVQIFSLVIFTMSNRLFKCIHNRHVLIRSYSQRIIHKHIALKNTCKALRYSHVTPSSTGWKFRIQYTNRYINSAENI